MATFGWLSAATIRNALFANIPNDAVVLANLSVLRAVGMVVVGLILGPKARIQAPPNLVDSTVGSTECPEDPARRTRACAG